MYLMKKNIKKAINFLMGEIKSFLEHCIKLPQKSRKTTLEMLDSTCKKAKIKVIRLHKIMSLS